MDVAGETRARRIVLCVDDVGLCAGIDEALLVLHAARRASAGSVLVDGPSLPRSAAPLRARAAAGLELGLHLNLTEALGSARPRPALPALVSAAWVQRLDATALRSEIRRQCERYAMMLGRRPDFIDGHQHVHQLPQVRDALLNELQRLGWRPWLRSTAVPAASPCNGEPWRGDRCKARFVAALGATGLARAAHARGLATSAHLLGVRRFDTDPVRFKAALSGWLRAAIDGDVLMTHPSSHPCCGDPLGRARVMEFEVLTGPCVDQLLQTHAVAIEAMRLIPTRSSPAACSRRRT